MGLGKVGIELERLCDRSVRQRNYLCWISSGQVRAQGRVATRQRRPRISAIGVNLDGMLQIADGFLGIGSVSSVEEILARQQGIIGSRIRGPADRQCRSLL